MATKVTDAFSAQGTELYVKIAGLNTQVFQIQKMGGPGSQVKIADKSTLSSPGGYEETQPLMKKLSPVPLTVIWDPADVAIQYLQASNAAYPQPLEEFTQVASDPSKRTVNFHAYVSKFDPTSDTNAMGMVAIELTPSGPPVFSVGGI